MTDQDTYLPIADYGAIGNLKTVALVGLNGSIDWCCFPEIDNPAVFCSLLDHAKGGRFQVAPARPLGSTQRYLPFTNIIETTFDAEGGRLVMTDFMPLHGALAPGEDHQAPPEIQRIVEAVGGDVEVEIIWAPRFDFAREVHTIAPTPSGFVAVAGDSRLAIGGLPPGAEPERDSQGPLVRQRVKLLAGHRLALVTRWDSADTDFTANIAQLALDRTIAAWRGWATMEQQPDSREWAGYWSDHVVRSELALKLMTFHPTGAIAAAPTTSLPETIGGVRNWDYRFSWIRDSSLAAQALNAMGHMAEAAAFIDWTEHVSAEQGEEGRDLRLMYSVRGRPCLPEEELSHLEGYRRSTPVRIGNEAAQQTQLDIYGDLLGAAYEFVRMDRDFDQATWDFLSHVADHALNIWQDPDEGIWEFRNGPFQFVYSKMMVWVALQRAGLLAAQGQLAGDPRRWKQAQDQLCIDILAKGYDTEQGAFTIAYGKKELDAANLLIPIREFLPIADPRVQSTIDRTMERLTENDLVYRYHMDDGLPGQEGTFVLCTFWLADALALSGRMDEAYRIFDGVASRVNHVGLLSEQIDPSSGAFLGNFPQAFSHMGLINTALYLAHMEGRKTPVPAPIGTEEHRAEARLILESGDNRITGSERPPAGVRES